MKFMRHLYYNLLVFRNNIILNFLLLGNIIVPKYFNDKIIEYKKITDNYYKYIILITISDEIEKKYNIDMITIGMSLYNNYKLILNGYNDDNDEILSNLSDSSDLSELTD